MATRNTSRGSQGDQNRGDAARRGTNASGREAAGGREAAASAGTGATSSRGTAQNSGASATGATGSQTGVATNSGSTSTGQSSARPTSGQSADRGAVDRQREVQTSRESRARGGTRPSTAGGMQRGGQSNVQGGTGTASRGQSAPVYGGYGAASSPFTMMRRMMEDMDRLFSDFGGGPALLPSSMFSGQGLADAGSSLQQSLPQGIWSPQIEMFERGNSLVVRADLPGLSKDDVDVELENDTLILRGERQNEHEDSREGFYRSERSYGSFYRAIPLPEGVNADACNATFDNGVLEVTIPQPASQDQGRKKVQIK